jgi:PAS domain-containing protein
MTLARQLIAERRARLSAERLLILKQAELSLANQKLGLRAEALSVEIDTVRSQNERVISDLGAATQQLQIAEQRLFLALETLKNGFAVFDASSRLLIANSAYFSIFDGLQAMRPAEIYVLWVWYSYSTFASFKFSKKYKEPSVSTAAFCAYCSSTSA